MDKKSVNKTWLATEDKELIFIVFCGFILCLVCACVMLTPLPVVISVWEPEQPRQDVDYRPINKSHLQWVTLHAASGERDTESVGVERGSEGELGRKNRPGEAHHLWYSQCLMPVTSPTPPLWQPTWKYSSPESDRFILSLKLLFEMRAREFAWDEGDLLKLPAALEACDVLPCDNRFFLRCTCMHDLLFYICVI